MKFTKVFIKTMREVPSEADTVSAKLMLRAGLIRKLGAGLYEWLPLGLRAVKKVEQIVREEMNSIDGQEVVLPILLPKTLWEETGRWGIYGKELFRLRDRKDNDFCLGPTHEEVITDLVRREVKSYRELPLMLYQFGTKFRDEIRPRFGVMRAREFVMKDAYSFHADEECAEKYYVRAYDAYKRICGRCGVNFRAVEAASGAIGGSFSHEFMVLAQTGEEEIVYCECGYSANTEKAECKAVESGENKETQLILEEINTPGVHTVSAVGKFMSAPTVKFIKSMIYVADGKPVLALVRGDYEINESKLGQVLNTAAVELAQPELIQKLTGAKVGFAGPVGLKEKVQIIADYSVMSIINGITGANKTDYHVKNLNPGRDFTPDNVVDIRKVVHGDKCARCGKDLQFCRGIEVGHTFKLGYKYSKSMNATFLDTAGAPKHFVMGCYGIGVTRMVAAAIEQGNDNNGIIWPIPLAPYVVNIVPVSYTGTQKEVADKIYDELTVAGIDVILDDRDERAGVKFKDSDLIGFPIRVTVSDRTLANNNSVEYKLRTTEKSEIVGIDEAVKRCIALGRK
ncbi:MAG: proline--tRNA ligase [Elusimicrobiota bacterium]